MKLTANFQICTSTETPLSCAGNHNHLDAAVIFDVFIGGADLSLHLRGEGIVFVWPVESNHKNRRGGWRRLRYVRYFDVAESQLFIALGWLDGGHGVERPADSQ